MADTRQYINKITLPSGGVYYIHDDRIDDITPIQYIGVTSTALSDGATTTTIDIVNGSTTTEYTAASGDLVFYSATGEKPFEEFIYNGTVWSLLGSETGELGELAYKDEATVSAVAAAQTWTQKTGTATVTGTNASSVVSGDVSLTASSKVTLLPITDVGSATTLTDAAAKTNYSVTDHNLVLSYANTGVTITPRQITTGSSTQIPTSYTASLDNATAAAQIWSQTSGSVTVTGTNASSAVTGTAE